VISPLELNAVINLNETRLEDLLPTVSALSVGLAGNVVRVVPIFGVREGLDAGVVVVQGHW
jgi:hypothetical protein